MKKSTDVKTVTVNGKTYDVTDGAIRMDRDTVEQMRLEDLPIGIMIRFDDGPEGVVEVVGVRFQGGKNAEVIVRFAHELIEDPVLSPSGYNDAIGTLVAERAKRMGDVYHVDVENTNALYPVWMALKMMTKSVTDLMDGGYVEAEKICEELGKLENRIRGLIGSC